MGDLVPIGGADIEAIVKAMQASGKTRQVIIHQTTYARMFVYCGEWVAECPRQGCNNVELMTHKPKHLIGVAHQRFVPKDVFVCSYCNYVTRSVHWPPNPAEIMEVLDRRPVPHTRNWYPEGHRLAVACGIPDGQTIEQLLNENAEHGVI